MVNKSNVSVRSSQDSKRGTLYENHLGMNIQGRNEWQVKSSQSVNKLQKKHNLQQFYLDQLIDNKSRNGLQSMTTGLGIKQRTSQTHLTTATKKRVELPEQSRNSKLKQHVSYGEFSN